MPPRPAPSPWAFPPWFALLARFPEGEVQGIELLLINVHPRSCQHVFQGSAGKLPVIFELLYGKIDIAPDHIGKIIGDKLINEVNHPFDMFCGPRCVIGSDHAKGVHIFVMFPDVSLGYLKYVRTFGIGLIDDLVIHVGEVFYISNLIAAITQVSDDNVEDNGRTGMAHVAYVIGGDPAYIDACVPGFDGPEWFFLFCYGVV